MTASKDKGTAAETAVVRYLRDIWPAVERRSLAGSQDRGDIAGLPGIVIEVKNEKRMTLAAYVEEAYREAMPSEIAVVWHKRRGRGSPGEWYVTMDGAAFVALLKETGR